MVSLHMLRWIVAHAEVESETRTIGAAKVDYADEKMACGNSRTRTLVLGEGSGAIDSRISRRRARRRRVARPHTTRRIHEHVWSDGIRRRWRAARSRVR